MEILHSLVSRCSRRPWFKSHSQFLLFISAFVHPVSILRVIINVRCSLITKSQIEWSSGNTLLSCSRYTRRPWFKSHSQFVLFISACVHPVYILRVIINVRCSLITKSEWKYFRLSGLVEILHSLVPDIPDVLGSNPTHSFFFLYLPVSILCTS